MEEDILPQDPQLAPDLPEVMPTDTAAPGATVEVSAPSEKPPTEPTDPSPVIGAIYDKIPEEKRTFGLDVFTEIMSDEEQRRNFYRTFKKQQGFKIDEDGFNRLIRDQFPDQKIEPSDKTPEREQDLRVDLEDKEETGYLASAWDWLSNSFVGNAVEAGNLQAEVGNMADMTNLNKWWNDEGLLYSETEIPAKDVTRLADILKAERIVGAKLQSAPDASAARDLTGKVFSSIISSGWGMYKKTLNDIKEVYEDKGTLAALARTVVASPSVIFAGGDLEAGGTFTKRLREAGQRAGLNPEDPEDLSILLQDATLREKASYDAVVAGATVLATDIAATAVGGPIVTKGAGFAKTAAMANRVGGTGGRAVGRTFTKLADAVPFQKVGTTGRIGIGMGIEAVGGMSGEILKTEFLGEEQSAEAIFLEGVAGGVTSTVTDLAPAIVTTAVDGRRQRRSSLALDVLLEAYTDPTSEITPEMMADISTKMKDAGMMGSDADEAAADALFEKTQRAYDSLPEEVRADVPLAREAMKQVIERNTVDDRIQELEASIAEKNNEEGTGKIKALLLGRRKKEAERLREKRDRMDASLERLGAGDAPRTLDDYNATNSLHTALAEDGVEADRIDGQIIGGVLEVADETMRPIYEEAARKAGLDIVNPSDIPVGITTPDSSGAVFVPALGNVPLVETDEGVVMFGDAVPQDGRITAYVELGDQLAAEGRALEQTVAEGDPQRVVWENLHKTGAATKNGDTFTFLPAPERKARSVAAMNRSMEALRSAPEDTSAPAAPDIEVEGVDTATDPLTGAKITRPESGKWKRSDSPVADQTVTVPIGDRGGDVHVVLDEGDAAAYKASEDYLKAQKGKKTTPNTADAPDMEVYNRVKALAERSGKKGTQTVVDARGDNGTADAARINQVMDDLQNDPNLTPDDIREAAEDMGVLPEDVPILEDEHDVAYDTVVDDPPSDMEGFKATKAGVEKFIEPLLGAPLKWSKKERQAKEYQLREAGRRNMRDPNPDPSNPASGLGEITGGLVLDAINGRILNPYERVAVEEAMVRYAMAVQNMQKLYAANPTNQKNLATLQSLQETLRTYTQAMGDQNSDVARILATLNVAFPLEGEIEAKLQEFLKENPSATETEIMRMMALAKDAETALKRYNQLLRDNAARAEQEKTDLAQEALDEIAAEEGDVDADAPTDGPGIDGKPPGDTPPTTERSPATGGPMAPIEVWARNILTAPPEGSAEFAERAAAVEAGTAPNKLNFMAAINQLARFYAKKAKDSSEPVSIDSLAEKVASLVNTVPPGRRSVDTDVAAMRGLVTEALPMNLKQYKREFNKTRDETVSNLVATAKAARRAVDLFKGLSSVPWNELLPEYKQGLRDAFTEIVKLATDLPGHPTRSVDLKDIDTILTALETDEVVSPEALRILAARMEMILTRAGLYDKSKELSRDQAQRQIDEGLGWVPPSTTTPKGAKMATDQAFNNALQEITDIAERGTTERSPVTGRVLSKIEQWAKGKLSKTGTTSRFSTLAAINQLARQYINNADDAGLPLSLEDLGGLLTDFVSIIPESDRAVAVGDIPTLLAEALPLNLQEFGRKAPAKAEVSTARKLTEIARSVNRASELADLLTSVPFDSILPTHLNALADAVSSSLSAAQGAGSASATVASLRAALDSLESDRVLSQKDLVALQKTLKEATAAAGATPAQTEKAARKTAQEAIDAELGIVTATPSSAATLSDSIQKRLAGALAELAALRDGNTTERSPVTGLVQDPLEQYALEVLTIPPAGTPAHVAYVARRRAGGDLDDTTTMAIVNQLTRAYIKHARDNGLPITLKDMADSVSALINTVPAGRHLIDASPENMLRLVTEALPLNLKEFGRAETLAKRAAVAGRVNEAANLTALAKTASEAFTLFDAMTTRPWDEVGPAQVDAMQAMYSKLLDESKGMSPTVTRAFAALGNEMKNLAAGKITSTAGMTALRGKLVKALKAAGLYERGEINPRKAQAEIDARIGATPPPPSAPYTSTVDESLARFQFEEALAVLEKAKSDQAWAEEQANRKPAERMYHAFWRKAGRAIQSSRQAVLSFDASFFGNQGWLALLTLPLLATYEQSRRIGVDIRNTLNPRDPIPNVWDNSRPAYSYLAQRLLGSIWNAWHKDAGMMEHAIQMTDPDVIEMQSLRGDSLTQLGTSIAATKKEEAAAADLAAWAERWEQRARARLGGFGGKLAETLYALPATGVARGFRFSENAYTNTMNALRIFKYKQYIATHPTADMETRKAYLEFVMDLTGRGVARGDIGNLAVHHGAAQILTAPRLYLSRANMLYHMVNATSDVIATSTGAKSVGPEYYANREIMKQYAAIAGVAIMAQVAMSMYDEEDENYGKSLMSSGGLNVTDVESSDFMRIRWADKSFDPTAGIGSWARLVGSALYEGSKSTSESDTKARFGTPGKTAERALRNKSLIDDTGQFLQYKLVPGVGALLGALSGNNAIGQSEGTTYGDAAANWLINGWTPIPVQEAAKFMAGSNQKIDLGTNTLTTPPTVGEIMGQTAGSLVGFNIIDYDNNIKHTQVLNYFDRIEWVPTVTTVDSDNYIKGGSSEIRFEDIDNSRFRKALHEKYRETVENEIGSWVLAQLQQGKEPRKGEVKFQLRRTKRDVGKATWDQLVRGVDWRMADPE